MIPFDAELAREVQLRAYAGFDPTQKRAADGTWAADDEGEDQAVAKHRRDMRLIPAHIRKRLEAAGVRWLVTGQSVGEMEPELSGIHPNGWSEGSTWDDVGGAYLAYKKLVLVGKGKSDGSTSVALHETGHAVSDVFGLSNHPRLMALQKAKHPKPGAYWAGVHGREELLAESFAVRVKLGQREAQKRYGVSYIGWLDKTLKLKPDPPIVRFTEFVHPRDFVFNPNQPRDRKGRWSRVGAAMLKGLSESDLHKKWATLNQRLEPYTGQAQHPEAKKLIARQKAVVRELHRRRVKHGQHRRRGPVRDVVVIGAGPAGLSAAIYGGTEGLDTLLIDENPRAGGQAGLSSRIENVLGFPAGMTGRKFASESLDQALRTGADTRFGVRATDIRDNADGTKTIELSDGSSVKAKSVVIAGGVQFRQLDFPGSDSPDVIYGDAYEIKKRARGKGAVIVGAGNSAGQAALEVLKEEPVTILSRKGSLRHDMSAYLVDQIEKHPRATVLEGAELDAAELDTDGRIEAVRLKDGKRIEAGSLGLFIGSMPKTAWAPVKKHTDGTIFVGDSDKQPLETSMPGVFAAGDVRHGGIRRVITAAADGAAAVSMVHKHLAYLDEREEKIRAQAKQAGDVVLDLEEEEDVATEWLEGAMTELDELHPETGLEGDDGPEDEAAVDFLWADEGVDFFDPDQPRDRLGQWSDRIGPLAGVSSRAKRTKAGDALLYRLTDMHIENVKALYAEDPRDAVALELSLNNAPTLSTIEAAKAAAREATQAYLQHKYPDGRVKLYRGGARRSGEHGLLSWTPKRSTALNFARGDVAKLRERDVAIGDVEIALPALGHWGMQEEEYLLHEHAHERWDGPKLRDVREQHNTPQSAVAKALGISESSYRRLERGDREPTAKEREALKAYLGRDFFDPRQPRDSHGRWVDMPDWWDEPSENRFFKGTKGEEILNWLDRHDVPKLPDGRYRFYHGMPKGGRRDTGGILRADSLLETDPEKAAFFAGRDRGLSRADVRVAELALRPDQIQTGIWAKLREDVPLEETKPSGYDAHRWFHATRKRNVGAIRAEGLKPRSQVSEHEFPTVGVDEDVVYLWPSRATAEEWVKYREGGKLSYDARTKTTTVDIGEPDSYEIVEVYGIEPSKLGPDHEQFSELVLRPYLFERSYGREMNMMTLPSGEGEREYARMLDDVGFWEEGHVGGPVRVSLREWLDRRPEMVYWSEAKPDGRFWQAQSPSEGPPPWMTNQRDPWRATIAALGEMPPALRSELARELSLRDRSVQFYGAIPSGNIDPPATDFYDPNQAVEMTPEQYAAWGVKEFEDEAGVDPSELRYQERG